MSKKSLGLILGATTLILAIGLSVFVVQNQLAKNLPQSEVVLDENSSAGGVDRENDAQFLDAIVPFDTRVWHEGVVIGTQTLYLADLFQVYADMFPNDLDHDKLADLSKWQQAASAVQDSAILIDEAEQAGLPMPDTFTTDSLASASGFLAFELAVREPRETISSVLSRRSAEKVVLQAKNQ